MVLRKLAEGWIGGGYGRDNLCKSYKGDTGAAVSLRDGDRPKPRIRKYVDFLGRQRSLLVTVPRLDGEFGGKPRSYAYGVCVGCYPMRIRTELERNISLNCIFHPNI